MILRKQEYVEVGVPPALLCRRYAYSVQVLIIDGLYWFEYEGHPTKPCTVIVDTSRELSLDVCFKRVIQVVDRDDLCQDVLQHTQEEVYRYIIILGDAGLPVATRSSEGTGAVP